MLITSMPGESWARMRLWAKEHNKATLLSILDSAEELRNRSPRLAGKLWNTAVRLATKLGYRESK